MGTPYLTSIKGKVIAAFCVPSRMYPTSAPDLERARSSEPTDESFHGFVCMESVRIGEGLTGLGKDTYLKISLPSFLADFSTTVWWSLGTQVDKVLSMPSVSDIDVGAIC